MTAGKTAPSLAVYPTHRSSSRQGLLICFYHFEIFILHSPCILQGSSTVERRVFFRIFSRAGSEFDSRPCSNTSINNTMAKTKWSDADREKLRKMYLDCVPVEEIAARLKRSVRAVQWKVSQDLQITRPHKYLGARCIKQHRTHYTDCIPNPFEGVKKLKFNKNYYRTL